jgi:ATP-dependent Lon protease
MGLLLRDNPNIEQPEPEQLRRVGTNAEILRYVTSEQTHYVICRGLRRFRVGDFLAPSISGRASRRSAYPR